MPTQIFDPLHNFMVGPLLVKLRKEVEDFRVFSHRDLVVNAYQLMSKYIGDMPDWYIRCEPRLGVHAPDIVVFQKYKIKAVCQFVFGLTTEKQSHLPALEIEEIIEWMKAMLEECAPKGAGRGYIVAAYDYDQRWFVPQTQEQQHINIVPVNCFDIALHNNWRPKWDELKKHLY